MAVDWRLIGSNANTAPSPWAQSLGSVADMLDAFAQRRLQQQRWEEEQKLKERSVARQEAMQQAQEDYWRDLARNQSQQQEWAHEDRQAAIDEKQRAKQAEEWAKTGPAVKSFVDQGNEAAALNTARSRGFYMERASKHAAEREPEPPVAPQSMVYSPVGNVIDGMTAEESQRAFEEDHARAVQEAERSAQDTQSDMVRGEESPPDMASAPWDIGSPLMDANQRDRAARSRLDAPGYNEERAQYKADLNAFQSSLAQHPDTWYIGPSKELATPYNKNQDLAALQVEAQRLKSSFDPSNYRGAHLQAAARAVQAEIDANPRAFAPSGNETMADKVERRFKEIAGLEKPSGGNTTVIRPLTRDQTIDNERQAVGEVRQQFKTWEDTARVSERLTEYQKAVRNAKMADSYRASGNTVSQRDLLYNVARAITGPGVLTATEYDNTVTNTTGWLNKVATKVSKLGTGAISDAEWKELEGYVREFKTINDALASETLENFNERFGNETYAMKTAPQEVEAYRRQVAKSFGIDLPAQRKAEAARKDKTASLGGRSAQSAPLVPGKDDDEAMKGIP